MFDIYLNMTITLVFVRHAQGTHNIDHENHPKNFDAELTSLGRQQTNNNMVSDNFDAVYCSPLRRCRATLLGIYPSSENLPVILDDRLMEQPCGLNICDKRLEKSDMVFPGAWNSSNVSEITPWTIDENADIDKIKTFTTELLNKHKTGGKILIVSHGNWIYKWFKMYTNKEVRLNNCQSVSINVDAVSDS